MHAGSRAVTPCNPRWVRLLPSCPHQHPGDELKEKQAAARDAAKEVREVARDNQGVLKQVAAAEAAIAEAERDVQQVSAWLAGWFGGMVIVSMQVVCMQG